MKRKAYYNTELVSLEKKPFIETKGLFGHCWTLAALIHQRHLCLLDLVFPVQWNASRKVIQ